MNLNFQLYHSKNLSPLDRTEWHSNHLQYWFDNISRIFSTYILLQCFEQVIFVSVEKRDARMYWILGSLPLKALFHIRNVTNNFLHIYWIKLDCKIVSTSSSKKSKKQTMTTIKIDKTVITPPPLAPFFSYKL